MKFLVTVFALFLSVFWMTNLEAAVRDHHYELDEHYALEEGGTIFLDSDDADVTVTASDRDDVRVRVYVHIKKGGLHFGKGYFMEEFEVEERKGNLYLDDIWSSSGNLVFFGFSSTEYRIDIDVPAWANLDFEGDDDNYKIEGVTGNISIDASDAGVAMRRCTPSKLKLELDDGDVYLKYCEGRAKIKMEDGDLKISKGKFAALKVRTDDGDIQIETALNEKGSYEIRTDDGDVQFEVMSGGANFEIEKDDGSVSTCSEYELLKKRDHWREYVLDGGGASVSMITEDGDIDLRAR